MNRRIIVLVSLLCTVVTILTLTLGCAKGPEAETPDKFYQGKTISWVASGTPGSTVDLFSRAMAQQFAKELGATVVVENKAGGGGWEGVNYTYNKAKPDGLTIGCRIYEIMTLSDVTRTPGAEFQSEKFNWLGVVHTGPPIFLVTAKKPYQTIQDLQQAKGLKFGSPSMGGDVIAEAAVIETLKLDAKIILGITAPELVLSLHKGEVDAIFGTETIAAKAIKDGAGKPLFTMYKKGSLLPDLPLFVNIAKMHPDNELLVKEFSGLSMTAFLPPNTPKDKTDYLRKVFSKISENRDSQQAIIKALGVNAWYGYTAGDSAQKSVEELKARKDIPDKIKQLVDKYRG